MLQALVYHVISNYIIHKQEQYILRENVIWLVLLDLFSEVEACKADGKDWRDTSERGSHAFVETTGSLG